MNYSTKLLDALALVKQEYFLIKTTYNEVGIVRERVFCYELYHQLRKQLGDELGVVLHGEIDKRGHPDYPKSLQYNSQRNPDLIIHKPGRHDYNSLVCEVKGLIKPTGICKDFETLLDFVTFRDYRKGVFLLYNCSLEQFTNKMIPYISN